MSYQINLVAGETDLRVCSFAMKTEEAHCAGFEHELEGRLIGLTAGGGSGSKRRRT